MTIPPPPPATQWVPPTDTTRRTSSSRIAILLATVGILVATAALVIGIVDLARPASRGPGTSPAPATPSTTFTPEQAAGAKKDLCSAYQLAARSVKADTNSADTVIARISLTNAAGILDAAANNPALADGERDTARKLAAAYRTIDAISSNFDKTSPVFQQSVDEANQADAAMAALCP